MAKHLTILALSVAVFLLLIAAGMSRTGENQPSPAPQIDAAALLRQEWQNRIDTDLEGLKAEISDLIQRGDLNRAGTIMGYLPDHPDIRTLRMQLLAVHEERAGAAARETQQRKTSQARAVVRPMTADFYPKTAAEWGSAGLKRLNDLMLKAAEKAAASGDCDAVADANLSDRSIPKKEAVFFVDCANGQRFYISEHQLDSPGTVRSKQAMLARVSEASVMAQCLEALKANLNYPSTFKSSVFSQASYRAPTGNIVVTIDFKAKNSFGAELPMTARCVHDERGLHPLEITSR